MLLDLGWMIIRGISELFWYCWGMFVGCVDVVMWVVGWCL